jgi:DNA polymerase-3 subunit epsilon
MMWWEGPLVGFDLETTHKEWDEARIVQFALCGVTLGNADWVSTRLVNPGITIPEENTAIHGIRDADVADAPTGPEAIEEIAQNVVRVLNDGVPMVAYNGRYDFTVLDRELRRYDLKPLEERVDVNFAAVIDPYVIDKAIDRYRPGKRTLSDLCRLYEIELTDAHDAGADAVAAAQLAYRMIDGEYALQIPLRDLFVRQIRWAREQALSLQSYLRRQNGDDTIVCAPEWPLVSVAQQ